MSNIAAIQSPKVSTCPHGLPAGACPICNGGAGGLSVRSQQSESVKKNEWSWMQCYIAGQTMRAQKNALAESKQLFEGQINSLRQMIQNINSYVAKMQDILQRVEKSLPPHLQPVFSKIANSILSPLLRALEKLPLILNNIARFLADLRNKILDVSQKLTVLLSDVKNYIDKKLVRNFKKITKKLLSFFILEEAYDEEEIDECNKEN